MFMVIYYLLCLTFFDIIVYNCCLHGIILDMDKIRNFDSIRVAIASALTAISIGLLAILHSSEKILGLFVIGGGFVVTVYNFVVFLLLVEIIVGIVFLLSTGFVYGFGDGKHSIAEWMRKRSYSALLVVFPVSFVSIIYNTVIKLFGLDSWGGVVVAIAVVVLFIVSLVLVLFRKNG